LDQAVASGDQLRGGGREAPTGRGVHSCISAVRRRSLPGQDVHVVGVRRWGNLGWLALAAVATLLAVGAVVNALWRVVHGDLVGLVTLPFGLLFWYWIGVGAWRRAIQHA
jgi:hypothetical protein